MTAPRPHLLFLRTHRVPAIVGVMGAGAVAVALTQYVEYGLSSADGEVTTPLVTLMPAVVGTAVAMATGAAAPSMGCVAGTRLARATRGLVVALTVVGVAMIATAVALAAAVRDEPVPAPVVMVLCRSMLGWAGLALVSAAVLRPPYAWVLPALSVVLVTLLGYDSAGAAHPWNVASAPAASVTTLGWAVGLLLVGFAASERSRLPWFGRLRLRSARRC